MQADLQRQYKEELMKKMKEDAIRKIESKKKKDPDTPDDSSQPASQNQDQKSGGGGDVDAAVQKRKQELLEGAKASESKQSKGQIKSSPTEQSASKAGGHESKSKQDPSSKFNKDEIMQSKKQQLLELAKNQVAEKQKGKSSKEATAPSNYDDELMKKKNALLQKAKADQQAEYDRKMIENAKKNKDGAGPAKIQPKADKTATPNNTSTPKQADSKRNDKPANQVPAMSKPTVGNSAKTAMEEPRLGEVKPVETRPNKTNNDSGSSNPTPKSMPVKVDRLAPTQAVKKPKEAKAEHMAIHDGSQSADDRYKSKFDPNAKNIMKVMDFEQNPDGGPIRIPKGYKMEIDAFKNS